MARATKIYVIYLGDDSPAYHFTVKHEAITFYERVLNSDPIATLYSFPDKGRFDRETEIERTLIPWPVYDDE